MDTFFIILASIGIVTLVAGRIYYEVLRRQNKKTYQEILSELEATKADRNRVISELESLTQEHQQTKEKFESISTVEFEVVKEDDVIALEGTPMHEFYESFEKADKEKKIKRWVVVPHTEAKPTSEKASKSADKGQTAEE